MSEGRLIDCVVTEVSRSGVCDPGSVYVSCDGPRPQDALSFTPALLNPGDWLEISALTDGLDGHVELSCWIVEESRPMKHRQRIFWPTVSEAVRTSIKDSFLGRSMLVSPIILAIISFALAIAAIIGQIVQP